MFTMVESVELILVPLKLNAPATTLPVPAACKIKSSLDLVAVISLPLTLIPLANKGDAYSSVKFSLVLIIASRNVSPVPSFAVVPTFKICRAILCVYYSPHCGNHMIVS